MRLEQLREPVPSGGPVVGLHGVADVDLVLEQHLLLGRQVGQVPDEADDHHVRPRAMSFPEHPHLVVERDRLGASHRR